MKAFMNQQYIPASAYLEEIRDYDAIQAMIDREDKEDNQKALDAFRLLTSVPTTTATSSSKQPTQKTADELQIVQKIRLLVSLSRKAFFFLRDAVPDDARLLIDNLITGYAFAAWNLLEKKYQNTEQDAVGTLWERLITLRQEDTELFADYKARLDTTCSLLSQAKQIPQPGLYSCLLIDRLGSDYNSIILALKASGQLADYNNIDWIKVGSFIAEQERSKQKQNALELDMSTHHALSAIRNNNYTNSKSPFADRFANFTCNNCGAKGHTDKWPKCPSFNKNKHKQPPSAPPPFAPPIHAASTTSEQANSVYQLPPFSYRNRDDYLGNFNCSF